MTDLGTGRRRPAALSLAASIIAALSLTAAAVLSAPAGAAPQPINGTASVAIGLSGVDVGVPQTSTFTGTLDPVTGVVHATVANTPLDLSLPIGADTYGLTGTFSNPGGFTGTVSGSTATLTGTARFTLTGFTIPGVTVPPILGFLGCNLDFVPMFTGTYEAVAGVIEVSDPSIVIPTFPTACATVLNAALGAAGLDFDINEMLGLLPPASATMTLHFDQPLGTTTTTSSTTSTTATSSTTTSTLAPTTTSTSTTTTLAPTTTTSTTTTLAPTTTTSTTTTLAPTTTSTSSTSTTSTSTTTGGPTTTTEAPPTSAPTTVPSPTTTVTSTTAAPGTTVEPGTSSAPTTVPDGEVGDTSVAPTTTGVPSTMASAAKPVSASPTYTG